MNNDQLQNQMDAQRQATGMGLLGQAGQASTKSNLRGEAGEALIQSERYASQVIRLKGMMCQMGIKEEEEQKASAEAACNPNDLNWTVRTTADTMRAANNQLEDLLNTLESELL